jgi:Acetyltransferase (GNAT) domain
LAKRGTRTAGPGVRGILAERPRGAERRGGGATAMGSPKPGCTLAVVTVRSRRQRHNDGGDLRLVIEESVDPREWNSLVGLLDGQVFHSLEYASVLYGRANSLPFFARAFDSGSCVALCCGGLEHSRIPVVGTYLQQAHLSATPVVRGAAFADVIEALKQALKRRGAIALLSDSYGASPGLAWPRADLVAESRRAEFLLDLTPGRDVLWQRLDKKRRATIRKCDTQGWVLRRGNAPSDLESLADLMAGSSHRARARTGEPFDASPRDRLLRIWRYLVAPGLATFYSADVDGERLSGNLVTLHNGKAYNLLAGSSSRGFAAGAASWLYWRITTDLLDRGFREFNLGGVDPDGAEAGRSGHGLFQFKKSFGARLVPCSSPHYVLAPRRHRAQATLARLRRGLVRSRG